MVEWIFKDSMTTLAGSQHCEVVALSSIKCIWPTNGQNTMVWESRGKRGSGPLIIVPNKPFHSICFMSPYILALLRENSWFLKRELKKKKKDKTLVLLNWKQKLIPSYFELLTLSLNLQEKKELFMNWGWKWMLTVARERGCAVCLLQVLFPVYVLQVIRTLRIVFLRLSCYLPSSLTQCRRQYASRDQ